MASGPLRRLGDTRSVVCVTDPAPRPPVRVLVVDPDDRTRESLCGLLGIGARCVVVGSAGEAARALALVGELQPDIVVVDANLDDAAAAKAFVVRVRAVSPSTRIIAMSRGDAADAERRCAGVDAVIRKTFRPRELVDALLGPGVAAG
jgi:two-component system nitrate/nitrite response regulator NarL